LMRRAVGAGSWDLFGIWGLGFAPLESGALSVLCQ
jgi:hypothetical protein